MEEIPKPTTAGIGEFNAITTISLALFEFGLKPFSCKSQLTLC
jgi:hypothetical protein